jgi:hypothetical protein
MDERKLIKAVLRRAAGTGLTDEQTAVAVCLAWYECRQFERTHGWTFNAFHWARLAVLHALQGRDVPGVQPSKKQDALDYAIQGCGMGNLMDRSPGPDREAAERELIGRWWGKLTEREKLVLRLLDTGLQKRQVARAIGVTAGRLSQILQKIADKAE